MIANYLKKVYEGRHLSAVEGAEAMRALMSGDTSPIQIAAFLTALHMKGETETEIAAFAKTMREKSQGLAWTRGDIIDTCGTGGDGQGTFNVSTAAAFVLAAGGVPVAKHGNRSVSSKCGSADILAALDAVIDLNAEQVSKCIEKTGIGFLFAQKFHPSMKYVAPVRRELGLRTVFNILGPLSNPFRTTHQMIGVFDPSLAKLMAYVLKDLGLKAAFVYHSRDGMDEISVFDQTEGYVFRDGSEPAEWVIDPNTYGLRLEPGAISDIRVSGPDQARDVFMGAVSGTNKTGAAMIELNAGVGFWLFGMDNDIESGIMRAKTLISDGKVVSLLDRYVAETRRFVRPLDA